MEDQRFEELLSGELAGELTAAERRELLDLLKANEDLRREHDVFKDFWAQKEPGYADMRLTLEKIKAEIRRQEARQEAPAAGQEIPEAAQEPHITPHKRLTRKWRTWSAAAALLLLLGGYGLLQKKKNRTEKDNLTWQEKYTPRNGRSKMTLADGSLVTLNADSRFKYPASFDGPAREVYLTGEAYFTIQKDAAHPFIIHTNKMTIRVLGTSFNVRCYPDDDAMETTLIQGSIEVTFPDRPADKIILKPTDKLVIRNDSAAALTTNTPGKPEAREDTNTPREQHTKYTLTGLTYYRNRPGTIVETSWMDNKLVFNAEELQSVTRKMERWYGVPIVIDNNDLRTLPFTGLFQNETIDEALYALRLSEKKLHYAKKDSVIHIF